MKSMLVIGLGRFGENLATTLAELGNEVMVLDVDEEKVAMVVNMVEQANIGDGSDESVLAELGVSEFDCCFVCLTQDFQASLEITAGLKDLGARRIVVKTDSERHARLLLKIGADEIIFPEKDMAKRAAVKYTAGNALEYFGLTDEYSVFEIVTPSEWVGRNIVELGIRTKYDINVIAIKDKERVVPVTSGEFRFKEGQSIILAGDRKTVSKLASRE